jgi:hypothetical protein
LLLLMLLLLLRLLPGSWSAGACGGLCHGVLQQ